MSRLKWHYRSAHESLISFSNVSFYDADLLTFPSIDTGVATTGLRFELRGRRRLRGQGTEPRRSAPRRRRGRAVRARAARSERAPACGRCRSASARSTCGSSSRSRTSSSCGGATIPSIEPFFDAAVPEPFFVKNLENIQGDERDVDLPQRHLREGRRRRLRYNFGPLNGENGWRRLNVLTTRARRAMRVFSSIRASDITRAASRRRTRLLREFLDYAEHGVSTCRAVVARRRGRVAVRARGASPT